MCKRSKLTVVRHIIRYSNIIYVVIRICKKNTPLLCLATCIPKLVFILLGIVENISISMSAKANMNETINYASVDYNLKGNPLKQQVVLLCR